MDVMRSTIAAALGFVLLAAPAAAPADPPAAGPPTPPSVFVGAPTSQNGGGGEFTVNFDGSGRFESVGRAPEHPGRFNVTYGRERRQAGMGSETSGEAAVNRIFLSFLRQLRTIDTGSTPSNR